MAEQKTEILDIQKEMFDRRQSPLRKYQNLMVGRRGLLPLIKYEFFNTFLRGCPGALGIALRRAFYRTWLGHMGKNVSFGFNVVLRHPHKIRIGDNVAIDDQCVLDAKGFDNVGVTIGSEVFIGRNTIIHCKNGSVNIRDGVNIGFNCDLAASGDIEIGEQVFIAAYSYLVGGGHEYALSRVPVMEQGRTAKGIRIGRGAWIGAGVIVLDGVTIGENALIGAGAVVTQSIPDRAVAVGIPARVVRIREEQDMPVG